MKRLAKQLADLIALFVVLPAWVGLRIGQALLGSEKGFAGWSQFFSLLPGVSSVYLRRAFYRLVLPECGEDSWISFGTILSHPTAKIGRRTYVGAFCVLGDVTLEEDVLLGSSVSIINGNQQHSIERLDIPVREQPGIFPRVTIGQDTWIGDRALVMASVGKHCVVGAASVVTKPLPDYAIVVGNPARIVRYRDGRGLQDEKLSTCTTPVNTGSR